MYSDDEESQESYVNYKLKYRELKKHLRALIYENECFQDELRKAQRNLVSISRDKSYLLDRILKYEKPVGVSSDSEATDSSDEEEESRIPQFTPVQSFTPRKKITKRKRSEAETPNGASSQSNDSYSYIPGKVAKTVPSKPVATKLAITKKPKKPPAPRKPSVKKERMSGETSHSGLTPMLKGYSLLSERPVSEENQLHMGRTTDFIDGVTTKYEFPSDAQINREDIERQLEARKYGPELELSTTATVPAELFNPEEESDLEESEMCEYVQLEEEGHLC